MTASSKRADFLRASQNSDGGWGYFPGKRSWLEPTVYSAIALSGEPAADRAFGLVQSWALKDGGWRVSTEVVDSNWTSALGLNLYVSRAVEDQAFRKSLHLLLRTLGTEGNVLSRIAQALWQPFELDNSVSGWPWLKGCASWVEPTVHSVISLTKILPKLQAREAELARERVALAEAMLRDRQCEDGGWNYGNRRILGEKLPSYPELTGLGLLGLQRTEWSGRNAAIQKAQQYLNSNISPLGVAWLSLAMRVNGLSEHVESRIGGTADHDVMVNALLVAAENPRGLEFFRRAN